MKILIAFATTEGHTHAVAQAMTNAAEAGGHEVTMCNVEEPLHGVDVADFDRVIAAGSVHSGHHQEALELFVFANREVLGNKPTLFVSVSMAAAFKDTAADAARYVEDFCERSEWRPTSHVLVAGATKHGALGWFEQTALGSGDVAAHLDKEMKEDRVFTDWDALNRAVTAFLDGGGTA